MITKIQIRRGTTAEWAAASPVVLAAGEPGWDSTLEGMKVGDGSTEWAALPWIDAKNRPDINADTLDGSHFADILLAIYPIGAIYQSVVSTSPATLFGGTWAALEGRFLIGVDETYTAGSTGGAATHDHGLSTAWAQVHMGGNLVMVGYYGTLPTAYPVNYGSITGQTTGVTQGVSKLGGSTQSVGNLPPYLSVYMWKRTA